MLLATLLADWRGIDMSRPNLIAALQIILSNAREDMQAGQANAAKTALKARNALRHMGAVA